MAVAARIGLAGLFLFAASAWFAKAAANTGLLLMLVGFVLAWPQIRAGLRGEPLPILAALFALYVGLRALGAGFELEVTAAAVQWGEALTWMELSLFVIVAWWSGSKPKRLPLLLGLALTSFFLSILFKTDWVHLSGFFAGAREGFGRAIPITALYSASALVGLLTLAPRFLGGACQRVWFAVRVVSWLLLTGFFLQILIVTQSRITWIAVLVVVPLVLSLHLYHVFRARGARFGRNALWLAVLGVMLLAGIVYANFATLTSRINAEREVMADLSEFRLDKVPYDTAIGARAHLWRYGFESWLERPLLGWGPGTRVTEFAPDGVSQYSHLHNTYLEVLVRLGLVGALLIGSVAWFTMRALWLALRSGKLPLDYFLAIIGILGVLAIWSIANFRMPVDWRYFCVFITGLAYGTRLRAASNSAVEPAS